MSAQLTPSNEHPYVKALTTLLDVRSLGDGVFSVASNREPGMYGGEQRRFGGELLAQALRSAEATLSEAVREARPVHSLHAYFLRPASPVADLHYRVRAVRDGRSFSLRSVEALHGDARVFSCDVSFQVRESGFEHAATMPTVPPPESLPTEQARFAAAHAATPERFPGWLDQAWQERGPFETRIVENLWQAPTHPPHMHCWVRLRSALPPSAPHAAIAAYYSDDPIMDNALLPHVGNVGWQQLTTASLDHAMWFHAPVDLSYWHLFAQDSPVAHGARGLTRGQLFRRDGSLVASVAQEILMRPRPADR